MQNEYNCHLHSCRYNNSNNSNNTNNTNKTNNTNTNTTTTTTSTTTTTTTNNNKYFISRGHSFDNTSIFHEDLKQ